VEAAATRMRVEDFDYELPEELIAQEAVEPRDAARLLVLDRASGALEHARVRDLGRWLRAGDRVVVNDTRVIPARLFARRATGGEVEVLLLEPAGSRAPAALAWDRWRALARPARRLSVGEELTVAGGLVVRLVDRVTADGRPTGSWVVELVSRGDEAVAALVERLGRPPLPPYIRRTADDARTARDRERYQTMFARQAGAVAAPTAGLHFTPRLVRELEERGVELARVTLHVGEGTFRPPSVDDVADHRMHAEVYAVPPETVAAVERCRAEGGRVVAIGTTSVRALESSVDVNGRLVARSGSTDLFLVPGARFHVVDALLTNFHLPRSTLLMLVSAFAGRERVLASYAEAVRERYRFFSYGDAMLIL